MNLHDDPISRLAMTLRKQDPALAALPWAEDEARWQKGVVIAVAAVALLSVVRFFFA